jgi:nicotinamidase-related amidase
MSNRLVAGTAPYPWPWDGALSPARLALVVVGCQRWWAERTPGSAVALAAVERAAAAVRDVGGLVVLVRHGRPSGPGRRATLLPRPGEVGWELVVTPARGDVVVEATGIDAFYASSLDADLRSLDRDLLAMAGLGLETAVYSTMAVANDRGYECLVLSDASAAHEPAVGERALCSITMSGGIFGAVGTATALCEAVALHNDPLPLPPAFDHLLPVRSGTPRYPTPPSTSIPQESRRGKEPA